MALYRYIYVVLIAIFFCVSGNTTSYANESGRGSVCMPYDVASNRSDPHGTTLLSKILGSVDEGILVRGKVHHSAVSSQGRDRDHFSVAYVVTTRWQISASALYFFFPAARGQVEEFVPIVRLLIFPKHWFW